jgi:hypothetical protein
MSYVDSESPCGFRQFSVFEIVRMDDSKELLSCVIHDAMPPVASEPYATQQVCCEIIVNNHINVSRYSATVTDVSVRVTGR